MTDYSRDRLGPDDDDRLPWLEPVEEEPENEGGASSRLIIGLIAALVLIGAVVGGFFWLRSSDSAASGDGALIPAPDSYYKERPAAEPTGADDEVVYSASKGNEVESVIDTSGAAETPVNIDREPAAAPTVQPIASASKPAPAAVKTTTLPAAKPEPKVVVVKPAPPKVEPKPKSEPVVAEPAPSSGGGGSGTIQLGAFSSQAKANAAWKNLSARFSFLSGLTSSVVPVESGEKTLYRLRASGGNGKDICGRLRTAGESCSVVG